MSCVIMFVTGHVGCCGGCMWVSKVAFLWGVCVCGLGIPVSGLGADCAIAEQAIRSAIKIHLLHLVGILFPHSLLRMNFPEDL